MSGRKSSGRKSSRKRGPRAEEGLSLEEQLGMDAGGTPAVAEPAERGASSGRARKRSKSRSRREEPAAEPPAEAKPAADDEPRRRAKKSGRRAREAAGEAPAAEPADPKPAAAEEEPRRRAKKSSRREPEAGGAEDEDEARRRRREERRRRKEAEAAAAAEAEAAAAAPAPAAAAEDDEEEARRKRREERRRKRREAEAAAAAEAEAPAPAPAPAAAAEDDEEEARRKRREERRRKRKEREDRAKAEAEGVAEPAPEPAPAPAPEPEPAPAPDVAEDDEEEARRKRREERRRKRKEREEREERERAEAEAAAKAAEEAKAAAETKAAPETDDYGEDDFEDYDDDDFEEAAPSPTKTKTKQPEQPAFHVSGSAVPDARDVAAARQARERAKQVTAGPGSSRVVHSDAAADCEPPSALNPRVRRAREVREHVRFTMERFTAVYEQMPLRPRDVYQRRLASGTHAQMAVGTADHHREMEVQTDEVEHADATAQAPDDLGYSQGQGQGEVAWARLRRPAGMLLTLLREAEERRAEAAGARLGADERGEGFSSGCRALDTAAPLLDGRAVVAVAAAGRRVLTAHGPAPEADSGGGGVLCVWETAPDGGGELAFVLGCEGVPTCCALSPERAHLAFAGTAEGSVLVWDLREPAAQHAQHAQQRRPPTFSTAADAVKEQQHCSALVTVQPMAEHGLQLASADDRGLLAVWVVVELAAPEPGGSEAELGLGIGSRVKLVRTQTRALQPQPLGPGVTAFGFVAADARAFCFGRSPAALCRGALGGGAVRELSAAAAAVGAVTCLAAAPFSAGHFLCGRDSGDLSLHHAAGAGDALATWTLDAAVAAVCWSPVRPGMFFALDAEGALSVFDLLSSDRGPTETVECDGGVAIAATRQGLVVGGARGVVVHSFSPAARLPKRRERELMGVWYESAF